MTEQILKLSLLLDRVPLTAYERAEAQTILQQLQKLILEQQKQIKDART